MTSMVYHGSAMACPLDAELLAFADGSLPAEVQSSIEIHLDTCPACFSIVVELAQGSASGTYPIGEAPSPSLAAPGPLLENGEARYVPGDEIARGGMGRILGAEDRLLGRRVALKLLHRDSAELVQRFQREQRITARLQHPAIVPVYDVGVLPGGEPFFVMRLVKGKSLDRTAKMANSLEDRLRLLPAVLGVVDAVAYAHEEGVVHRDLKPQNVLVGPFGEVVVLDWGLARVLDAVTEPAGGPKEAGGDDPEATRDGEVLGTLAYMAPEQAEGRVADARSDVYGLGAILYQVLAGAPPHMGRRASRSIDGAPHVPVSLARCVPGVPLDLVAIVERAMAPAPEARYPSAQQLAEDLKRWQAGRLVEAHRYTRGELFRRFVRRYRAPILVAVMALVVLAIAGGVGVQRIFAERDFARAEQVRAETAQTRAETANARAGAQRAAAETLVGFVLGDLRGRLERVGRLDALAGVAQAVTNYQDRSPDPEDTASWLRRAEIAELAGKLAVFNGDLDAADRSFERSIQAAEHVKEGYEASRIRCSAVLGTAIVALRRDKLVEASALAERCVLSAAEIERPGFRALSLEKRIILARSAWRRGEPALARKILDDGLADTDALIAETGGLGGDPAELALTFRHYRAEFSVRSVGQTSRCEDARAVLEMARARAEARPDDLGARFALADEYGLVGRAERVCGGIAAAEAALRHALAECSLLVVREPSDLRYLSCATLIGDELSTVLRERGDKSEAMAILREGKAMAERGVALAPGDQVLKKNVAVLTHHLGVHLADLGRLDEAYAEIRQAVDIMEGLATPEREQFNETMMSEFLGDLADVEVRMRRLAAAKAHYERSVVLSRRRFADTGTAELRYQLAKGLVGLARIEPPARALACMQEAVALMEPVRASAAPHERELIRVVDAMLKKAKAGK